MQAKILASSVVDLNSFLRWGMQDDNALFSKYVFLVIGERWYLLECPNCSFSTQWTCTHKLKKKNIQRRMAATAIVNIAIQIKLSMLLHFMPLQSLFFSAVIRIIMVFKQPMPVIILKTQWNTFSLYYNLEKQWKTMKCPERKWV